MIDGWCISPEIALRWLLLDLNDDEFKLWLGAVRQQAITRANVDPDLCRHMAWVGHNELINENINAVDIVSPYSDSML